LPLFKDQVRSVVVGSGEHEGRRSSSQGGDEDDTQERSDSPRRAAARSPQPLPSFKDQVRHLPDAGPSSPPQATDVSPEFKDQVRDSPLQRRLQRHHQHEVPKTRAPVVEDNRMFEAQTNNTRREVGVGAHAVTMGTRNSNRERDMNEEESEPAISTTESAPVEAELVERPVEAEAVHIDKRKCVLMALFSIIALLVIGGVVVGSVCGTTGACSGGGSSSSLEPLDPPAPCDVKATLDCQTLDGRSCADIGPPYTASCFDGSGGGIAVLEFRYQNETQCNSTSNMQGSEAICIDSAPLVAGPVDIRCSHYTSYGDLCACCTQNKELTVFPEKVYPGDIFAVSEPNGGQLPQKFECTIGDDYYGTEFQRIVIDTSGTVGLNLGDKFGSLQVETCDALSCVEDVRYIVQITNVGGESMFITDMTLTTQEVAENQTDSLQQDSLSPGESTFVERRVEIDTCSGLEFSSQVNVKANLTNGEMLCQGSDEFLFKVAPLPPLPANPTIAPSKRLPDSCVISLEVDCVFTGDDCFTGLSCSVPYIEPYEPCLTPPESIQMLYHGGGCERSGGGTQSQVAFSCKDFNGGPPLNDGGQSYIRVENNGTVFFEGIVAVSDLFEFSTNSSIIQDIIISTPDRSTVLQEIRYHTSCLAKPSPLFADYGTLQTTRRTLVDEGLGSTFTFAKDIQIPITAFGEDVTLTGLTAKTNFPAGDLDLTDIVIGQIASPGGTVVVTLEGALDTSSRVSYFLEPHIEGTRNEDGELCTGTETISFAFDIGTQT